MAPVDQKQPAPDAPLHVAIVMDGNGRWAKRRFLPRLAGHKQGVESLRRCLKACAARGVAVLTVFAFSSENWNRPHDEVSGLMELMGKALLREVPQLVHDGVRLRFVGERGGLSAGMREALAQAEAATAQGARMLLNVCFIQARFHQECTRLQRETITMRRGKSY